MKVALCVPDFNPLLNITCVPFGLGYVAAYLREHTENVEVILVDGMIGHDVRRRLIEFQPDIIGVTASTPQINDAYRLLHWCKVAFKNPLTVIGGIHASALPDEAKEHADIVVVGEGEIAFTQIVKNHLPRKPHKSIVYGTPIKNLDDLPYPPFDLFEMEEYIKHGSFLPRLKAPIMNMLTSRGCPFRCPFCGNSCRYTKVRYFSAERVVNEILYVHNHYGVDDFYFSDDEFLLNTKRLKSLALLFKTHGIDKWIRWGCQARTHNLKQETVNLAKSMGCVAVSFGLESGNQRMLNYWKNSTTSVKDHERAIKTTSEAGIATGGSFIFGWVDETLEEMTESFEWILNQDGLVFVGVGTIIPYPATTVWRTCIEKKLLPNPVDYDRLVPTAYSTRTYIINQTMKPENYEKFLVKVARVTRLYCDLRLNPSIKHFFGLAKSKRWWWTLVFHPRHMFQLFRKVLEIRYN